MRKIIVGFSSPIKFKIGAELIKWRYNTKYSHVYIQYFDNQGRELVFQAAHGLVHILTLEHFLEDNKTITSFKINLSDEEYQQFRDFYYDKCGQPYDFFDLIKIMLHDFGVNVGTNNGKGYICSELSARLLNEIKHISLDKPSWLMRPDDIERILVQYGATRINT